MRWLAVVVALSSLPQASLPQVAVPAPADQGLQVLRGVPVESADGTEGFEQALEPRELHFPQDQGPHPAFRHEWWYVTGNLDSDAGERFGFELTFFRIGLLAEADATTASGTAAWSSPWRTHEIYMAHFAITDVARGSFEFAQKYSRQALDLAGARADPLRVWLDDWSLSQVPASGPSAIQHWRLRAAEPGYELILDAQPLTPPVLNGDRGLSRKSTETGAASYYYSIPRVAVHGQLQRGGERVPVKGLAWLDREWGSGALGEQQQGWDWFALQLQDHSTLMFYSMRRQDGSRDPLSAGTWLDAGGQAHQLSSAQVSLDVSAYWVSPRGVRYPSGWRVRVPTLALDARIQPVLQNQELLTHPRYWEGAVDVHGSIHGSQTLGRGYVELVGYGE